MRLNSGFHTYIPERSINQGSPPLLHRPPLHRMSTNSHAIQDDLKGHYRRWWLHQFSDSSNMPKLRTFHLFKTSFAPSEYLNEGPSYFRPAVIRFRCSNHRLDVELSRHNNVPRSDRTCRFCSATVIGDEYHAFQCVYFLDLQVFCDINVRSKPQFIHMMTQFTTPAQRYITLLMSRIKLR